jgi:3-deoxy-D-manno-octulosonic-acid transferase
MRQPAYLRHWGERWGFYSRSSCDPASPPAAPRIWLHAVSVGETRAAEPLVRALLAALPECRLLLTAMTPTGRETARLLYGDDPRIQRLYLPYDVPGAVARFLDHFRPAAGILMETEIWPNLMFAARRRHLPMFLVNARLSRRSARGYARFGALTRPALASLAAVAAQTRSDARRLMALGAQRVTVCGNLKFDVAPDAALLDLGDAWRAHVGARFVWLAASTRAGEEDLLLDILRRLHLHHPEILLVLVPRHPERFLAVAGAIRAQGFSCQRRSQGLPEPENAVWLGDSMGEMPAYYRLADVAFIGGSLLPLGGQNLIEAAACGCPALVGPHTFNFAEASQSAISQGAARRIADADALLEALRELAAAPAAREAMRHAGLAFAARHRGATKRIMRILAHAGIGHPAPNATPDADA